MLSRWRPPRHQSADAEQTDPSGLIYMQARFYLPMWGRFASPDPARDQHFEQTQSWNIYSYVQNNPVSFLDPDGQKLVLSGNATAELDRAMAYLAKSQAGREIVNYINMIKNSDTINLDLKVDTRVYYTNSAGDEIQWNPQIGTAVIDNPNDRTSETGEVQSPALALAHEIIHKMEKDRVGEKGIDRSAAPPYDNKEERRAVEKENKIAKQLGEPSRKNSTGNDVKVKDSTSRNPVEPTVQKRLEEARRKGQR
ncbi:RHS repeat-associated core domain-containing protein [Mesoterricola sediminis]|nr:RHS repeat-associated core domain-containing protein [Mesoterricola sediminis]